MPWSRCWFRSERDLRSSWGGIAYHANYCDVQLLFIPNPYRQVYVIMIIAATTMPTVKHWPLEDTANNFESVISHMLRIKLISSSCEIALSWIPQSILDDKSSLFQVMALCHQSPSHNLGQYWPRFMSLHGVTRTKWFNVSWHHANYITSVVSQPLRNLFWR